jgi:hypothetical protein
MARGSRVNQVSGVELEQLRDALPAETCREELNAAHLFERGPAGPRFHGVADEGVPTRDIADVIGRRLSVPVVSIPLEQAAAHFNWLARYFALDIPASSTRTREQLDWHPASRACSPISNRGDTSNREARRRSSASSRSRAADPEGLKHGLSVARAERTLPRQIEVEIIDVAQPIRRYREGLVD